MGTTNDSYKIDLYVQIFDDSDAITVYKINDWVNVEANIDLFESIVSDIVFSNSSVNASFISNLTNSDVYTQVNTILSMSSVFDSAKNRFRRKKVYIYLFI